MNLNIIISVSEMFLSRLRIQHISPYTLFLCNCIRGLSPSSNQCPLSHGGARRALRGVPVTFSGSLRVVAITQTGISSVSSVSDTSFSQRCSLPGLTDSRKTVSNFQTRSLISRPKRVTVHHSTPLSISVFSRRLVLFSPLSLL